MATPTSSRCWYKQLTFSSLVWRTKFYTELYKLWLPKHDDKRFTEQRNNKYCGETARGAETLRRPVEKKHGGTLKLYINKTGRATSLK